MSMKRRKVKKEWGIALMIPAIGIIILAVISFINFGKKLHFFPLILVLGSIMNGISSLYYIQKKKKRYAVLFGIACLLLFAVGILLFLQIWSVI